MRKRLIAVTVLVAPCALSQSVREAAYLKRCGQCHDHPDARIPPKDTLNRLSITRIMRTLDFGVMMSIAYPMKRDEREAVAAYLGTKNAEAPPPAAAFCSDRAVKLSASAPSDW